MRALGLLLLCGACGGSSVVDAPAAADARAGGVGALRLDFALYVEPYCPISVNIVRNHTDLVCSAYHDEVPSCTATLSYTGAIHVVLSSVFEGPPPDGPIPHCCLKQAFGCGPGSVLTGPGWECHVDRTEDSVVFLDVDACP